MIHVVLTVLNRSRGLQRSGLCLFLQNDNKSYAGMAGATRIVLSSSTRMAKLCFWAVATLSVVWNFLICGSGWNRPSVSI